MDIYFMEGKEKKKKIYKIFVFVKKRCIKNF